MIWALILLLGSAALGLGVAIGCARLFASYPGEDPNRIVHLEDKEWYQQ